ncbi:MAG: hypothetical protein LUG16_03595, partial [Candidatus Gastranaerophilales bacterium]|nr:hypothetical protein [Candidatus Gastranaerophilales bacterium]
ILSKENGSKISDFIKNNRFTKYFTNDYKAIPKNSFAKSGQTLTEKYKSEIISNVNSAISGENNQLITKLKDETKNLIKKDPKSLTSKDVLNILDDVVVNIGDNAASQKTKIAGLKNKFLAADSQLGKTVLGQGCAKTMLKTKDLLTFGGGIIGLAFAANGLVNTIKETKEAPKGEKLSTFMHVLSEQYVGILLFQPSINLLYKLGGNKYRGMSTQGRDALKNLVHNTNASENLTKEAYKVAKIQKNLLLKGVDKDKVASLAGKGLEEAKAAARNLKNEGAKLKIWEKPLKFAGQLLDTGLDTLKSPTTAGKMGNKVKGFAGGFARFALIMFVLQPFLQKPVTKLCHKVFGEPKTYLNKKGAGSENKTKKTSDKNQNTTQNYNQAVQLNQTKAPVKNPSANILDNNKQQLNTNNQPVPSQSSPVQPSAAQPVLSQSSPVLSPVAQSISSQPIASSNISTSENLQNNNIDSASYIPSIEIVKDATEEESLNKYADDVIKQTNSIVKNAQKYIKKY